MAVTVDPATFSYVFFEAPAIERVTADVAARLGFADDEAIRVEVDEKVPMGRARILSVDPIVLEVESGALEDPRKLRHLSEQGSADILGRLLLQVRDRRDPDFGAPDLDEELSLAHRVSWAVHCAGRQERLGYPIQRQRRLYAFRTRHGFTDEADRAFDALWSADSLTWAQLTAWSDGAIAAAADQVYIPT